MIYNIINKIIHIQLIILMQIYLIFKIKSVFFSVNLDTIHDEKKDVLTKLPLTCWMLHVLHFSSNSIAICIIIHFLLFWGFFFQGNVSYEARRVNLKVSSCRERSDPGDEVARIVSVRRGNSLLIKLIFIN